MRLGITLNQRGALRRRLGRAPVTRFRDRRWPRGQLQALLGAPDFPQSDRLRVIGLRAKRAPKERRGQTQLTLCEVRRAQQQLYLRSAALPTRKAVEHLGHAIVVFACQGDTSAEQRQLKLATQAKGGQLVQGRLSALNVPLRQAAVR